MRLRRVSLLCLSLLAVALLAAAEATSRSNYGIVLTHEDGGGDGRGPRHLLQIQNSTTCKRTVAYCSTCRFQVVGGVSKAVCIKVRCTRRSASLAHVLDAAGRVDLGFCVFRHVLQLTEAANIADVFVASPQVVPVHASQTNLSCPASFRHPPPTLPVQTV